VLSLWDRLNGSKYRYVLVTALVSLLAFGRNLLFMKTLDLAALGQVALMQTLVMLVGFVQLGLINGAFIQYSARDRDMNRRIVELMTTGVLALLPVAAILVFVAGASDIVRNVLWAETLTIGLVAGIATIASTWLNNALVADGLLGQSNLINLSAVTLSLAVAFMSRDHGLTAALLSVLIQPLTVALLATAIDPNLRPRAFGIHRETLRLLMRLGFMPFIAGLLVLVMHQLERWSIAAILGPEALGHFYLVLMYSAFFGLIPGALLNAFFPQAKRAYGAQEKALLLDFVCRHLRDLLVYFLLAVVVTVLVMPWAVARFLPEFTDSQRLVYFALPGLVLFSLRDSASLVLFSSGQMRPLITAGLVTLGAYCFGLVALWAAGRFSLNSVLIARMIAIFLGTILLMVAQRRQIKDLALT
jgi:O-antigen/teichoic acid export membrane protein